MVGLKPADVERQYLLIGNSFYLLQWQDQKLVLSNQIGSVQGVLQVQLKSNQDPYGYGGGYPYNYGNNPITVSERYSQMFELLLSRSLNVSRETEAAKLRMGPNLLRVFLYAKMPSEFAVQNKRLGNQDGRVLYSITLSTDDLTPSTDDVK